MSTSVSADRSARFWDVQVIADLLGCSTRHVRRLSDAGKMPRPVKLGALVRWSKAAIEDWIARSCPAFRNTKKGT